MTDRYLNYSLLLFAVLMLNGCGGFSSEKAIRFQQYYAEGELIYHKNCSNCHQKSGKGLGLLYPPVASSDYLDQHFDQVLCLVKYGIKGEIVVNGKQFNKPMPGVRSLTELEIAELATYLTNSWGHEHGIVQPDEVRKALLLCEP